MCDDCRLDTCPVIPSRCYRCKKLTQDFAVCVGCRKSSRLKHVWVRTEYDESAKKLIYALKFRASRSAAAVIGSLMCDELPFFSSEITLSYIPTATARRRLRGFDHAKLISLAVASDTRLQSLSLLGRHGQARQVGASREVRIKQLKDVFYLKTKSVKNKKIILVDDIVTTGGTLEAAASLLMSLGAKQVDAIVFAQK